MTTYLELQDITFQYDKTLVLHEFSLQVKEHESLILLGKSGSGKTTILNIILGLLRPQAGDILLQGESILDTSPEQRSFGYVPQGQVLFPHLTVKENILFPLKAKGIVKTEQEKRLQEITELVGLQNLLSRLPREISGGQAQRVALARAVIPQPRLLLLDEPLSSIDAVDKEALALEIKRVQRETGTTMIYVTHDQIEARLVADRVALLVNGELKRVDDIKTLSEHPGSPEIAELLGLPNVVHKALENTLTQFGLKTYKDLGYIPVRSIQARTRNEARNKPCVKATFMLAYLNPDGQVIGVAQVKNMKARLKFLMTEEQVFHPGQEIWLEILP